MSLLKNENLIINVNDIKLIKSQFITLTDSRFNKKFLQYRYLKDDIGKFFYYWLKIDIVAIIEAISVYNFEYESQLLSAVSRSSRQ